jgi:hypothetical protein
MSDSDSDEEITKKAIKNMKAELNSDEDAEQSEDNSSS